MSIRREKDLNQEQLDEMLVPTDGIQLVPFSTDKAQIRPTEIVIGDKGYRIYEKDIFPQLCASVGIPRHYTAKCPIDLALTNLTYWWTSHPELLQLVVKQGPTEMEVRGVVGPKHQIVSPRDVVHRLQARFPGATVRLDNSLMATNVRLITEDNESRTEVKAVGDVIRKGVSVIYSILDDIGFEINSFGEVLRCTNGMTSNEQRYVRNRKSIADFWPWFDSSIDAAYANAQQDIDKLVRTADVPLPNGWKIVMDQLFQTLTLPLSAKKEVQRQFEEQQPTTLYGVLMILTNVGTFADTAYVRQVILQQAAQIASDTSFCDSCHRPLISGVRHRHGRGEPEQGQ